MTLTDISDALKAAGSGLAVLIAWAALSRLMGM